MPPASLFQSPAAKNKKINIKLRSTYFEYQCRQSERYMLDLTIILHLTLHYVLIIYII